MASPSKLASMSVDALLKLRDEIGVILSRKADDLKRQLLQLGGEKAGNVVGNNRKRRHALSGRKLPPKYRNPKTGESWSGRGMMAGWLKAAMKGGAKKEDFLVTKVATSKKKSAVKRGRKKK